ncbi:dihydrolipoyl dehydrogenase [candidate division WOR-3 bacterium]|nr:dihydrolipoyl dehydrogenase [candidate division WOR-3 bacterium]
MHKFDIAIIGSGSAGYVAGIRGAQLGSRVCIIEKSKIGGVCLNQGCIPTKALLATVKTLNTIKEAQDFGISVNSPSAELWLKPKINFKQVIDRKNKIVQRLVAGVNFLLKQNKIDIFHETAIIREPLRGLRRAQSSREGRGEPHYLKVGNETIEAKSIIIATGSRPFSPFKIDGNHIVSSDEALNFDQPPKSILIIGGGVIGVEFATIFSGFGSQVTLVEMLPCILPEVKDKKIVQVLRKSLLNQEIKIIEGNKVEELNCTDKGVLTSLSNGKEILSEKVLVACGRIPNSEDFESLRLKIKNHSIVVNKFMRTNIPNIYACGDVVGPPLLAHKASKEGEIAVENASGLNHKMDYNSIPNCIFSEPEIAWVGKFESEVKNAKVGEYPFQGIGKALCIGETMGFVKVIVNEKNKVKGVQIIGPNASDLIPIGVLAVKKGLSAEELGELVYPHPTLSEALREASLDVAHRAIHKIKK